ncbi:MAG TPA: zinc-binding alcohol dehydrogenase [Lacunisphaera sp.]|nr:zinc-binding alcohol dehydrogenase [Lacunisphaera sp.]
MTSNVVRLYGPCDLRIDQETHDLDALAPNEVAARTLYTAVSTGTEVAAYRGDPPLRPTPTPYPRLVGYCNVAEVVAVGPAVRRFAKGDRVLSGQSHCSGYVCDEAKIYLKLPDEIDSAIAATTYLFQIGYEALHLAKVQSGHNVAVIGLGPLGLAATACARMMDARVFGLSNVESSLATARHWGATALRKDRTDGLAQIERATLGTGIDCVLTTSNAWDDWLLALRLARIGGTISIVGFPGRGLPPPSFNPLDSAFLYDKALTIISGSKFTREPPDLSPATARFTLRRSLAHLLQQILAGRLDPRPLIGRTVPATDIGNLYREMDESRGALLTALIKW